MKNQVKKFSQYIKESNSEYGGEHNAAVIFDPATGNLEIMFGNNLMYDYHGLEDAANEGNEVHVVQYNPEGGGIYVINGKLDLSGVNVLMSL
jgi:hypothetical protein